jgi:hypothetical protein
MTTYLRDFRHASKIFLPNSQSNAPKVKFLFHVYFEINEQAYKPPTGDNFGILVKSVKLPSFKFDTEIMNQYNRKRIIQTKIKYDPIEVVFHDDNQSQMTAMWNAYYQYNYADSVNQTDVLGVAKAGVGAKYQARNIYNPSIEGDDNYGYRGGSTQEDGTKIPFFKDITVFGFWQQNFLAYTLINPIITSFAHDTYDYAEGGGVMSNTMTLDYETVTYNTGKMDAASPELFVTGFANNANYDRTESPLDSYASNSPTSSPIGDTASGAYDNQNTQVRPSSVSIINQGLKSALAANQSNSPNTRTPSATAFFPTNASSPTDINQANQGQPTGSNNNTVVDAPRTAGVQVTGNR